MALNTEITPQWIAREQLRIAANKTPFVGSIRRKLSDDFKVSGVKVGATVGLRLPPRFITAKGQAAQLQPLTDSIVYVTITDQAQTAWSYSSFSATLEIQDARDRYVMPAATNMANTMDSDGLTRLYQDVFMVEGTPGTIPSTNLTYMNARARITTISGGSGGPYEMTMGPLMRPVIANANQNLFSVPDKDAAGVWREAMFSGPALSWDAWSEDPNIATHTIGPLGGTPTVNGAGQTGSSLVTQAWTAAAANRLNKGDIFTIASVFAVNMQNYRSTTQLQQFVVTANTASDGAGAATIPIYPPIITSGAYQTVDSSPANAAALTIFGAANTVTPQALGYAPDAFVMASADLEMPNSGESNRVRMPAVGLSMRSWRQSDIMTDQHIWRNDIIYGFKTVRPEFAVRIAS